MAKKRKALTSDAIALEEAQLRLEYYEMLFALAKEEYGVDIKKVLGERNRGVVEAMEGKPCLSDGG